MPRSLKDKITKLRSTEISFRRHLRHLKYLLNICRQGVSIEENIWVFVAQGVAMFNKLFCLLHIATN